MSERKNHLSSAQPTEAVPVAGIQGEPASKSRSNGGRRRRVSKEEAREIGRLYGDTSTPTSEIRERFGIGDSSLYRIVQQQGVALRGRTAPRARSKPARAAATIVAVPRGSDRHQFRISFVGEREVTADDVQDALRQAQSFGAVEVTAVSRID